MKIQIRPFQYTVEKASIGLDVSGHVGDQPERPLTADVAADATGRAGLELGVGVSIADCVLRIQIRRHIGDIGSVLWIHIRRHIGRIARDSGIAAGMAAV